MENEKFNEMVESWRTVLGGQYWTGYGKILVVSHDRWHLTLKKT